MDIPSKKAFINDICIGVVIALVSIPISMGYALVAGLPVAYGLYGSLLPILIFAFVSSSPRFVFGVDAAPAAIVGGMIASLGLSFDYAATTPIIPIITLFVSLWLFVFFLIRAERVVKFISEPVMGGFISGISTTIILMQVPKLFGGVATHGEAAGLLLHIVRQAGTSFNLPSALLGVGTVAILLASKKLSPKLPMQPILMFLGAGVAFIFEKQFDALGIARLPSVDRGLPHIFVPDFSVLSRTDLGSFALDSLTIAMVILSETLLATTNIARKYNDKINPRREIAAYALGNLSAAFCGCCPINGSISRTGIADQLGVKSQVMSITASLTMALILLFGTGFIHYLPIPVLTGIVIAALIGTLEFKLAHKLKRVDRAEFLIFYAAFFAVLFFGTIYGVLVGVLLATVTFIIKLSKPESDFLGIVPGIKGYYSLTRRNTQALPIKGVVIYRFSAPLFYANIEQFYSEVMEAASDKKRTVPVRLVIADGSGIASVDFVAAQRLVGLYEELKRRGIDFVLAGHVSFVNDQLRAFGAKILIENKAVRPRILYALKAAGFTPPYTIDDAESYNEENAGQAQAAQNKYSEQIAELEWAYGTESEKVLAELAKKMPQSEQSELEQELYFEELAMLNPEMAKQVASIISEMETACEKTPCREPQVKTTR